MNPIRLILAGLVHHWRMNLAVALGAAAGTAVLTGALLVGDSVRGSLRALTLERLGRIDAVLVVDRFFRSELADELKTAPDFPAAYQAVLPVIMLRATAVEPDSGRLASRVTLVGCEESFWSAGAGGPSRQPAEGEIVLNEPLAAEIGVAAGDEVVLRIARVDSVPPDNPLGKKNETIISLRLTVLEVIAAEGLGRFGMQPNQQAPPNAYASVATLQAALEQPGRVNALLAIGKQHDQPASQAAFEALRQSLRPSLADYGIGIDTVDVEQGAYHDVTSRRMLLEPAVEQAAARAFAGLAPQPALTYLANTIAAGEREIPYSTVAAIDFTSTPPLGPFRTPEGNAIEPLTNDEIVLNAWAADDLNVQPGATIRLVYFEPESAHGEVREASAEFRLKAVVSMEGVAVDRRLTPELPGVTDQLAIGDWNPPFPFDARRVRQRDEDYWDDYRAVPKAFVSLETGRRLWGSRFGRTTSIRIPVQDDLTAERLATRFRPDPASLGFEFRPVKRLGLAASSGTTPFHLLFLGFSFFIIAAAVMLTALLFRLEMEQRAEQIGVLLAGGWRMAKVRRLLVGEGFVTSTLGAALGVAIGVGYAWLMLVGLRSWWLAAISTPFLNLHVTPTSLVIGALCGVAVALAAILQAVWRIRHASVRRLLAGRFSEPPGVTRKASRRGVFIMGALLALALVAQGAATRLDAEAQAGAFFGSGVLVLAALLALVWRFFTRQPGGVLSASGPAALERLAIRNIGRHPGRSTTTIALVASAAFLIVAMSAFRLDPMQDAQRRDGGTGGFALLAESDQPIYQNLNQSEARYELGFGTAAEKKLTPATLFSLRVRAGDDASCLNLYQSMRPRVLGVSDELIERGGFAWAATAAEPAAEQENPWLLLRRDFGAAPDGEPIIPVVIDQSTAMYSLHLAGVGDQYTIDAGPGERTVFQVVGLLRNSVLQGSLLVGESQFLELYPDVSGYRLFLIDVAAADVDREATISEVEQAFEKTLGDYGFDAARAEQILAGYMAVQNTYLSTFQTLGGLGLLLGTFGLATVELRNVLERRGELAVMRAEGFRRRRLAWMVMVENAALLLFGLAIGVAAAAVAVLPHWIAGGASIPVASLTLTVLFVLGVGLLAGLIAVRAVLTAPLLPALRGE